MMHNKVTVALFIAIFAMACAAPEGDSSEDDLSVEVESLADAASDIERTDIAIPESVTVVWTDASFTQEGVTYERPSVHVGYDDIPGAFVCASLSKRRFRALVAKLPDETKKAAKDLPGVFGVMPNTFTIKDGEASAWRITGDSRAWFASNYDNGVCKLPTRSQFVSAFAIKAGGVGAKCRSDASCVESGKCDASAKRCLPLPVFSQ